MNIIEANNLHEKIFTDKLEKVPTRNGMGEALAEIANDNEKIVGLSADLTESTRMHLFAEAFPKRFIQVGIAEQSLAGVASGLALEGKIPFASSYSVFSPGRNWDQVRVSICYSQANVKLVATHAGLSVGPDGATHQGLEDIAITRVLPNMTVIVPADYEQAKRATEALVEHRGPAYLRLSRSGVPAFTTPDTPFEIGKVQKLTSGNSVTIAACGTLVYSALEVAHELMKEGISAEVFNVHTIKPLDIDPIEMSVRKTNRLITFEEHQIHGGLGSAILEGLADRYPVRTHVIGMQDEFGQSAEAEELFEHYKLDSHSLYHRVKGILQS